MGEDSHVRLEVGPVVADGRIAVSQTIERPGEGVIRFGFRDFALLPDRVRGLEVRCDGRRLEHQEVDHVFWNSKVSVPSGTRELQVTYLIDPRWCPPGEPLREGSRQVCFVRPEASVIRTTVAFPRWECGTGPTTIAFRLQPGWTALAPWARVESQTFWAPGMTDEYIALGPFSSEVESIGETESQIGRSGALSSPPNGTSTEDIMRLVRWLADRLGLRGLKQHHSVAVLPGSLLRGGASGEQSLVCDDSPVTLAHEIAHWWIGKAFSMAPDATWFGEGVHSYYAYRCLWKSGLWNRERFSSALLALESQVRSMEHEAGHAYSLGQASIMYWKSADPWHDVIYRKGALFGLLLDARIQELTRGGSTLDHLLAVLCKTGSRNVSTVDITVALQGALGVNASNVIETFVNRGTVIPSVRDLLTLVAE